MAKKKHLHEKLGISLAELLALLGVEAALKAGLIKHQVRPEVVPGAHEFNMGDFMRVEQCGTVGCIGGYMGLTLGKGANAIDKYNPNGIATYVHSACNQKLHDLFYPPEQDYEYSSITVKETLQAIANYKRTGDANWSKVLRLNRRRYRR